MTIVLLDAIPLHQWNPLRRSSYINLVLELEKIPLDFDLLLQILRHFFLCPR
jgi:hypothetical protein